MFDKIKNRTSYKGRVFQYIFLLIAALVCVFCAYTYYDYTKECQANALREAQVKASRIVSQNDERLGNLRQYYVAMTDSDTIKWLLENNVDYSDYSSYKAAYDDMSSKGIFSDYVNSFTFVNFKTGWVLSNKGLFHLYEAYNSDTAMSIYEEKTKDGAQKIYWKYDTGVTLPTTVDRRYRLTIETEGLNLVMHLPVSSYNTYAIFVANIDTEAWQKWVKEWLESYEELVVLDADGGIIYATNESLADECVLQDGIIKAQGTSYAAAGTTSSVLGWNYYVLYDIKEGQSGIRMPVAIWVVILVLVLGFCAVAGKLIYNPIGALVRDVAQTDGRIAGNELEYLAGSYRDLRNDKLALEGLLYQQQDKLWELFELRLIHGEVDVEEWDEYIESFGLRAWKRFATAVVILSPRDEEEQSIVNEDALCLKLLSEMPKEIKDKAWMPPIYNAGAIFAIFAEDDDDALLDKMREFYRSMQEFAKKACDYSILMGVSAVHTDYRHVRAAYRESINALMFKASGSLSSAGQEDEEESCRFYLESLSEHQGGGV